MADTIVNALGRFPVGTELAAYPEAKAGERAGRGVSPAGLAATDTATVEADGTATFDGLTEGESYVIHAAVPTGDVEVTVTEATAGGAGVNEIQTVTLAGATGGDFTLTFDDGFTPEETDPLAFDADPADVQTALLALDAVLAGEVSVTGAPGAYVIQFTGSLAGQDVAILVADGTGLTGPVEHRFVHVQGEIEA